MPKLTIDGKEVAAPDGINLIEAARLAGSKIPHYCYHSKLSVAGNCRICLVEIEKQGKLQIGCNTKVAEGMVVHTQSPKVLEARQNVLEFILVNHPIDCPVCDQAGECKLQKYYMEHDLKASRVPEEEKVHKNKALSLGPHVMLDQERCILCSRCIRFCKEIAKKDELCFTQRGNHTELTTFEGRRLENAYSVNTVDICPVGALTSKDFRFQQRVWFLKETESICPGCSTGCNIRISHNQGKIYRLLPRDNEAVNQVWMCDEGRSMYKPVNDCPESHLRLRHPKVREEGRFVESRRDKVPQALLDMFKNIAPSAILGIGSADFTNEDNFAFQKFLKECLGVSDFAYQAFEADNPSHDDFLISADKNPNRAGVEALGWKPLTQDKRYKAFLVLGEMARETLEKIAIDREPRVVFFAAHDRPSIEAADMVLPIALWAEVEGTVTNRQQRVQRLRAAFPPPGEARPVWQWVSEIAREWKKNKPAYRRWEEVMADLSETVPAFRGLNVEKVGKQGALLSGS